MSRIEWISAIIVILGFFVKNSHSTSIGDTLSAGNCTERCLGEVSELESCQCDDECLKRNDCCDDYSTTCLANRTTSCQGRCFGYVQNASCYCDEKCSKYGNCCSDYVEECANITLCENRCFFWYDSKKPCQCNDQCQKYGNCCEDFEANCIPGSCDGRCNTRNSTAACNCDSGCKASRFDCCGDYEEECTVEGSCRGLCGMSYDSGKECQCNKDCEKYNNCCSDYKLQCSELFLCAGRCNISHAACSCEETCIDKKNCCTDYEETCKGGSSWLNDECTKNQDMICPSGFETAPVILFSIDGFRDDYIYRYLSPNLWKLASCGVHAPYMRSVYPTLTFPNHYTIATGLYPESHGIIGNRMYDHELEEEFRLGGSNSMHSYWWGGEPIWVTTSNQGLKSACYFWVGSDVNITRYPDYYYPYDGSVPNEERVYQALRWLDLPAEERPSLMTMYMDIVDHAGHSHGPVSPETNDAIAEADRIIGMLMDGLKMRNLDKCVNLIVLADHGMANRSCDRLTYIDQYGVNMDNVYFRGGAHGRVGKSENKDLWPLFDAYDTRDKLKCHDEANFQSFLKYEDLPIRYHYANNDRIEDVHLVLDNSWIVGGKTGTSTSCSGGTHGWDNEYKQMHAVFLAHGIGFKRNFNTSEPFANIEIYNLITDLLDLKPAPNNGTAGALYNIMKNPPTLDAESEGTAAETCSYPSDTDTADDNLGCNVCEGEPEANQQLHLTSQQVAQFNSDNFILGEPKIFPAADTDDVRFCLLTQKDYVTAYDHNKKMPFYTAYVLEREVRDFGQDQSNCIRPDIRIPGDEQTPCTDFESQPNISQALFFSSDLSKGNLKTDSLLTTNAFPAYKGLKPIWNQFVRVLANWADMYNGISVVSGPVFDYNYDGHADSMEIMKKSGKFLRQDDTNSTPIPTHVFVVATRCRHYNTGVSVRECIDSPDDNDVISFVIPNFKEEPCYKSTLSAAEWVSNTLYEHVARLKDVELLTGISFFSKWTGQTSNQETRISALKAKLRLPEFTGSWLQDFTNEATPNPDVYGTSTEADKSMTTADIEDFETTTGAANSMIPYNLRIFITSSFSLVLIFRKYLL